MNHETEEFVDAEEIAVDAIKPLRIRFPAVSWSAKSYDSVLLKPPTIGMLQAAARKGGAIDQQVTLMQQSSGLPEQVIIKLPPQVLTRASEYFERFMPPAPATGESSSPT